MTTSDVFNTTDDAAIEALLATFLREHQQSMAKLVESEEETWKKRSAMAGWEFILDAKREKVSADNL